MKHNDERYWTSKLLMNGWKVIGPEWINNDFAYDLFAFLLLEFAKKSVCSVVGQIVTAEFLKIAVSSKRCFPYSIELQMSRLTID